MPLQAQNNKNFEPVYTPELPNFAKSLKGLNILQVRQLENGVDRATLSFMGGESLLNDNISFLPYQEVVINTRRTDTVILQESEYVTDNDVILTEFNELVDNLDIESIDLEIDTSMGDIDIKGLIMSSIYRQMTELRLPGDSYIMTNYRLLCFLNNNTEKKFRTFYKKETSFNYVVNDDMGDVIIIGSNDNTNGPIFYMFNNEMTKSKLYALPNTNTKFKKLVIHRIDKDEIDKDEIDKDGIDKDGIDKDGIDNTVNEIMDDVTDEQQYIPIPPDGLPIGEVANDNLIWTESQVNDIREAESSISMDEPTVFPYTLQENGNSTTIIIDDINPGFNLLEIIESVFRKVMTVVSNKNPYNVVTNAKLGAFISEQSSFTLTNIGGVSDPNQKIELGTCMGFTFLLDASMTWDDDRFLLMDNEENIIHRIVIIDENSDLI